jgi:hypothetical protein
MLTTYRRHNPVKCRFTSRTEYRCKCPIWVTGTDKDGRFRREALKLRDWNRAQELVRKWDVEGDKPKGRVRVSIEEWRDQFIHDAEARNLSNGTMRLYKLLFRQLIQFANERGVRLANNMDLAALTDFRASWKIGGLTAAKKLERLRSIFKFALQRKMVDENYAAGLVGPKVKHNPTLPFSKDEMARILKAADSPEVDKRVKAFILTMRHSGLRISDVSTLAVESLKDRRLKLYQAKTGEPVSVLLPTNVADALRATPRSNPQYLFLDWRIKVGDRYGFLAGADIRRAHLGKGLGAPSPLPGHVRRVSIGGRSLNRNRQHLARPFQHPGDGKALQSVGQDPPRCLRPGRFECGPLVISSYNYGTIFKTSHKKQGKSGGGVWKSNPPFDPRRAESPALKAGKVTGPLSPPLVEYHHDKALIGDTKAYAFRGLALVLLGCRLRF